MRSEFIFLILNSFLFKQLPAGLEEGLREGYSYHLKGEAQFSSFQIILLPSVCRGCFSSEVPEFSFPFKKYFMEKKKKKRWTAEWPLCGRVRVVHSEMAETSTQQYYAASKKMHLSPYNKFTFGELGYPTSHQAGQHRAGLLCLRRWTGEQQLLAFSQTSPTRR